MELSPQQQLRSRHPRLVEPRRAERPVRGRPDSAAGPPPATQRSRGLCPPASFLPTRHTALAVVARRCWGRRVVRSSCHPRDVMPWCLSGLMTFRLCLVDSQPDERTDRVTGVVDTTQTRREQPGLGTHVAVGPSSLHRGGDGHRVPCSNCRSPAAGNPRASPRPAPGQLGLVSRGCRDESPPTGGSELRALVLPRSGWPEVRQGGVRGPCLSAALRSPNICLRVRMAFSLCVRLSPVFSFS